MKYKLHKEKTTLEKNVASLVYGLKWPLRKNCCVNMRGLSDLIATTANCPALPSICRCASLGQCTQRKLSPPYLTPISENQGICIHYIVFYIIKTLTQWLSKCIQYHFYDHFTFTIRLR